MNKALECRNLIVQNDDFRLGPINFELQKGTITCLLGRNGAGKTTLLKSLLGLQDVENGSISFGQYNFIQHEKEIRLITASVFDRFSINHDFNSNYLSKTLENATKNDIPFNTVKFFDLLERFKIDPKTSFKNLSLGSQKKISLFIAICREPEILLIDEVTSNFDVISIKEILDLLLEFMEEPNHTILISTNDIHDIANITDYVMVLKEGQLVQYSDIETLRMAHNTQSLEEIFIETIQGGRQYV